MSNEFEFEIKGNENSFIRMLENNNIPYTRTPTTRQREESHDRLYSMTYESIRDLLTPENIRLLIALTPFALEKIWKWYTGRGKGSKVSVKIEGDILELDDSAMKALGKFFNEASKQKTKGKRRKR